MSLLVVGSIAFDTIEAAGQKHENLLGGSATYFSWIASLYSPVHLVGIVGEDFPAEHIEGFKSRGVCTKGLQIVPGETFRWWGRYMDDMNHRETIEVDLNVFEHFDPILPPEYQVSPYVFLGNGSPELQAKVLDQMTTPPRFVALDTMNLWIEIKRPALLKVLKRINALIINDEEAKMLADEHNLIKAGRKIIDMGPQYVVLKKGEHGCVLISEEGIFSTTAFPLEDFKDPTGAGDSFGGGFMGYLSSRDKVDFEAMKKAIIHGTVAASFTVENFGISAVKELALSQIESRMDEFMSLVTVSV